MTSTQMIFILDRSGSMSGLEKDTIGGFNSLIQKQKKEEGDAYVTLVLFDHQVDVVYENKNIQEVAPLTEKEYYTRGMTGLLDAVGMQIQTQLYQQTKHKADHVIFVITTDGYENSSKEYTYSKVKDLIEKTKEAGFEYIFLGAGIDAVGEASKLGISQERAATYCNDASGIEACYESSTVFISNVRKSCSNSNWKQSIEKDNKKRAAGK